MSNQHNTITFNTSRLYTREGQVITASYDNVTNMVYFHDHSRMVYGEFSQSFRTMDPIEEQTDYFIRTLMSKYDAGKVEYYSPTARDLERQDTVHIGRF